jgi:hypothetical protein
MSAWSTAWKWNLPDAFGTSGRCERIVAASRWSAVGSAAAATELAEGRRRKREGRRALPPPPALPPKPAPFSLSAEEGEMCARS